MFLVANTGQMYQLLIVIMQCAKSHDSNDKMAAECYVHKQSDLAIDIISCVELPQMQ